MIWWIVAAILYIIGIFIAYYCFIEKWEDRIKFEKVWFSCFWVVLPPLYLIHRIYNRFFVNSNTSQEESV